MPRAGGRVSDGPAAHHPSHHDSDDASFKFPHAVLGRPAGGPGAGGRPLPVAPAPQCQHVTPSGVKDVYYHIEQTLCRPGPARGLRLVKGRSCESPRPADHYAATGGLQRSRRVDAAESTHHDLSVIDRDGLSQRSTMTVIAVTPTILVTGPGRANL
jgi:hypothetical protein